MPEENYVELQKNSGIRVGDYVRVIRSARDNEDGWVNSWTSEMSDYIDKVFKVRNISGHSGIGLGQYHFPYFVLRVTDKPNEITIQEGDIFESGNISLVVEKQMRSGYICRITEGDILQHFVREYSHEEIAVRYKKVK